MNKPPILLAVGLIIFCSGAARASIIESTSHVSEATVFTDRAMVTRSVKVHVPAGAQQVVVNDMPAGLNEASLRVQGSAAASVKIGAVEVKHLYLTELASAAERDKTAQLEARTGDKDQLQAEIDALKTKQEFIARVVNAGALDHNNGGEAKLDFSPEKWQKAWDLAQAGMTDTGKALAVKAAAMKKIDADIARLQSELEQVKSQTAKERREARISVEAAADTDLDLALTYQTGGASWRPVYEARLDTGAAQLQLEQYGSVVQNTGEDWEDVALTLSTAQPAQGAEMPALRDWWVRLFQPAYLSSTMNAAADMAPAPMMAKSRAMMAAAPAAQVEAMPEEAAVVTGDYSAQFKVPGRVRLKSTQDSTKFYIAAMKMKATLAAQTIPRLDAHAYLFATATNAESYPVLPGSVAKYRDGAFIGNAGMPLVRPGEEAKFAFGVDDRIKIERQTIKVTQDNPALVVLGDMTAARQFQTNVQNLHKEPVQLTVFEQYPVAADADVKVTLVSDQTTPGYQPDAEKRQGVIEWTDLLQPGQEKTYTFGFQVKYPKGRPVQGL